jgi:hypothetical protein
MCIMSSAVLLTQAPGSWGEERRMEQELPLPPRTTTRAQWRGIYRATREWARGDWARPRPQYAELAFGRFGVWGVYPDGYTAKDSLRDRRGLRRN